MSDRRGFLKRILALTPLWLLPGADQVSVDVSDPKKKFMVFVDSRTFGEVNIPDGVDMQVTSITPLPNQKLADCVVLYEIGEQDICPDTEG